MMSECGSDTNSVVSEEDLHLLDGGESMTELQRIRMALRDGNRLQADMILRRDSSLLLQNDSLTRGTLLHWAVSQLRPLADVRWICTQKLGSSLLLSKDRNGRLPLHVALRKNCSISIVEYLVNQMIDNVNGMKSLMKLEEEIEWSDETSWPSDEKKHVKETVGSLLKRYKYKEKLSIYKEFVREMTKPERRGFMSYESVRSNFASYAEKMVGSREVNLCHTLTIGLQVLFSRLGDNLSTPEECQLHTAQDGTLCGNQGDSLLVGRYKLVEEIGRGAFSQLFRAVDTFLQHEVAIKVTNSKYGFIGVQEAFRLKELECSDPHGVTCVVKETHTFHYRDHFCLALELLHEDMKTCAQMFRPYSIPIPVFRRIAVQLLSTFGYMKKIGMIHADVKPENVLLAEPFGSPKQQYDVRLIDFGNAFTMEEADAYYSDFSVQSLPYRAPEVLLGIPFDTSIDIWSLGVLLVELYTGESLFSGSCEKDFVECIHKRLRPIPSSMWNEGKIKYNELNIMDFDEDGEVFGYNSLSQILRTRDPEFVTFILGLLDVDPSTRFTPEQALCHSFLSHYFPFNILFGEHIPLTHSGLAFRSCGWTKSRRTFRFCETGVTKESKPNVTTKNSVAITIDSNRPEKRRRVDEGEDADIEMKISESTEESLRGDALKNFVDSILSDESEDEGEGDDDNEEEVVVDTVNQTSSSHKGKDEDDIMLI